jgi:hypothetical protein
VTGTCTCVTVTWSRPEYVKGRGGGTSVEVLEAVLDLGRDALLLGD